jgi:hypothetical protein
MRGHRAVALVRRVILLGLLIKSRVELTNLGHNIGVVLEAGSIFGRGHYL